MKKVLMAPLFTLVFMLGFLSLCYPDIILYDGGTRTVIDPLGTSGRPQINNASWVVWNGHSIGIWLYDGTTSSQLSPTGSYPQINNSGWVVWDGPGVWLYDGTTPSLIPDGSYGMVPHINDNGWVVWFACDAGPSYSCPEGDFEIYVYDGTSTRQITDNDYDDCNPKVNNNGWMVWGGNGIWLCDGISATQIAMNGSHPDLNDNGWVVWMGSDDSDAEIFLYDGESTVQITNNDYEDEYPQINNSGWVVWEQGTEAFIPDFFLSDEEIFLYDGDHTVRLTENFWYDTRPHINDQGQVVWGSNVPTGSWAVANAEASVYGPNSVNASGTFNWLAVFLGSIGSAVLFRIRRMRRRESICAGNRAVSVVGIAPFLSI